MTTKIFISLVLNLPFSFALGQNLQIKKEKKISYDYSFIKFGGQVKTDTVILEYNIDGKLKEPHSGDNIITLKYRKLNSIATLMSTRALRHQREYWSDSSFIDIYTNNFGDSIIEVKMSGNDTIQISKSFFFRKKLIKSQNQYFRYQYINPNQIKLYNKKTKNRERATIITFYENGLTDTTKVENNKRRRCYKTLAFNTAKNEWYIKEKIKYQQSKKIIWETFYQNYHKMYFSTKTTTLYNKRKLPISETQYDTYLKQVNIKTVYEYEYY